MGPRVDSKEQQPEVLRVWGSVERLAEGTGSVSATARVTEGAETMPDTASDRKLSHEEPTSPVHLFIT